MGISVVKPGPVYVERTAKPAPVTRNFFNGVEWLCSVPLFASGKYNGVTQQVEPAMSGRSRMLNTMVKIAVVGVFTYIKATRVFIATATLFLLATRTILRLSVDSLFTFRADREPAKKAGGESAPAKKVEGSAQQQPPVLSLDQLRTEFNPVLAGRDGQAKIDADRKLKEMYGTSSLMFSFSNGAKVILGAIRPETRELDNRLTLHDGVVQPDAFVVVDTNTTIELPYQKYGFSEEHVDVCFLDESLKTGEKGKAEFFYGAGGKERIQKIVLFTIERLKQGKKIYKHCASGVDRAFALDIANGLYLAGDVSDNTYHKVVEYALEKRVLGNNSYRNPLQDMAKDFESFKRFMKEKLDEMQTIFSAKKLASISPILDFMEKDSVDGVLLKTAEFRKLLNDLKNKIESLEDELKDRAKALFKKVDDGKNSYLAKWQFYRYYIIPVREAVAELLEAEKDSVRRTLDGELAKAASDDVVADVAE